MTTNAPTREGLAAAILTRRHLLVVIDGENTHGVEPDRVAAAIGRRPEAERPSMYFVGTLSPSISTLVCSAAFVTPAAC